MEEGGRTGRTPPPITPKKVFFAKLKLEFLYVIGGGVLMPSYYPNGKQNREGGESDTTIRSISHYNLPLGKKPELP